MMSHVPLTECEQGVIYRLHSRNLDLGVYDGKEGFIGIREKFGSRFLDNEIHHDAGGTAYPLEVLGRVNTSRIALSVGNQALFDYLDAMATPGEKHR